MISLNRPHPQTLSLEARTISIVVLFMWFSLFIPSFGYSEEAECGVLYETSYGVYVDLGSDQGLKANTSAWVIQDGDRVARVKIEEVTQRTAFLRFLSKNNPKFPEKGKRYVLSYTKSDKYVPPEGERSPTLKDQNSPDETFIPLLVRPGTEEARVSTDARNIFHGRITVLHLFGGPLEGNREISSTRVRSSGSLERIESTPWTLEWSGDLGFRGGDGFNHLHDHEELRFELYRFAFSRRFDDHSRVVFGRFIPRELPSIGFIDGAQGEKVIDDQWRVGGVVGFKPDRRTLDPTADEPSVAPYITYYQGSSPDENHFSSTTGLLFSLYEGQADRLALLNDSKIRWGKLDVFSTAELDLDIGNTEVRNGPRLTRWDVLASYPVNDSFTLRGGWDRFERPDTEAERTLLRHEDFDDLEVLTDEFLRIWIGADHQLSKNWRLSEEIGFIDSEYEDGVRWLISLNHRGLPYFEDGSYTISLFSLEGIGDRGAGVRISAHVPVVKHSLFLQPSIAVRYTSFSLGGETFFTEETEDLYVTDVQLRGQWLISKSWMFSGGGQMTFTDEDAFFAMDLALTFKW